MHSIRSIACVASKPGSAEREVEEESEDVAEEEEEDINTSQDIYEELDDEEQAKGNVNSQLLS